MPRRGDFGVVPEGGSGSAHPHRFAMELTDEQLDAVGMAVRGRCSGQLRRIPEAALPLEKLRGLGNQEVASGRNCRRYWSGVMPAWRRKIIEK